MMSFNDESASGSSSCLLTALWLLLVGLLVFNSVRQWLSAFPFFPISTSVNPTPIPIPMPAKHLYPFPLLSHVDSPIPFHSHSRLPYINNCVEQLMEALTFLCHSTIVLATQIHDTIFNTCVTEDRNKSHYGPLCESHKQRAQSIAYTVI